RGRPRPAPPAPAPPSRRGSAGSPPPPPGQLLQRHVVRVELVRPPRSPVTLEHALQRDLRLERDEPLRLAWGVVRTALRRQRVERTHGDHLLRVEDDPAQVLLGRRGPRG